MKPLTSPLALVAAAFLSACPGSDTGGDPPVGGGDGNDTFATAQAVAVGSATMGVVSSASDHDWYKVTTAGAGEVTVMIGALSADADLALLDASQVSLGSSAHTGTATDAVTYAAAGAGTFYVHVLPVAAPASYTMTVIFTPAGGDGNDTFGSAQAVTGGSTSHGVISSATDEDWYTFTTTGAGTITITLTGLSADANLALYNSTPTSLGSSANTGTANDTVTYTAAAAGTFYAQVLPQAVGASYTLGVIFTPAVAGDGNDTFDTAEAIVIGATISGVISSSADPDWYRVTTPGAGTITVTLSGLTADADLELYGAGTGFLVDQSQFAGTANDTVSFTTGAAFTYRVLVKPLASSTPYTLTASFTP